MAWVLGASGRQGAATKDDAYLLECEMRARKFSGAYTGTSGTLAADVLRLLKELSRIKGEAAVERARRVDA